MGPVPISLRNSPIFNNLNANIAMGPVPISYGACPHRPPVDARFIVDSRLAKALQSRVSHPFSTFDSWHENQEISRRRNSII